MLAPPGVDQNKVGPEQRAKARSVVSSDGQAAARLRTVKRERPDNGMAAAPKSASQSVAIGRLIGRIDQKVKRSAIVPDVIGA